MPGQSTESSSSFEQESFPAVIASPSEELIPAAQIIQTEHDADAVSLS